VIAINEIGGYFGLEQFAGTEYYENLISLNTARNCLLYLLNARNIKKLYIPYFLCDSVSGICQSYGYKYEYYSTDFKFMPIFEKELSDTEYLYIVNYYGQVTEEKIYALKEKYSYIIVDNTQAFFQKPVTNIDTIYSCRKFFGVPDGAYLSTNVKLSDELETDISGCRMKHILGRYEGNAADYYWDFKDSDETFKSEPLKYMSKLTRNILGAVDYERVRNVRSKNYRYLAERLDGENKLKLVEPIGAFAYPFYMGNASEIKRALAQKKIYIPTLWPNVLSQMPKDSIEYDYTANILPLPCDQRYTTDDMQYVLEEMSKIYGEGKRVDISSGF